MKIFSRKNKFIFFHENLVMFEKKIFAKSFPKNCTKKILSDNFRDPRFSKSLTKNFSRNIFSRKFSRNVIFRENFFSINSYSSNLSITSNNFETIEKPHQVIANQPNKNNTKEKFMRKRSIFLLSSFVVALLVLITGLFIGIFGAFG